MNKNTLTRMTTVVVAAIALAVTQGAHADEQPTHAPSSSPSRSDKTGVRQAERARQSNQRDNEEATTAAQKVRQALEAHETLAAEEVRIAPRGDGILVSGKVSSEAVKQRIVELAKSAGVSKVDFNLEVKSK